jgi:ABC-2 type transport system permease protein
MRKTWLIIKREYLTGVRTKAFIITTILLPTLGAGFFALIIFIVNHQGSQSARLAIVDEAGGMASSIEDGLKTKLPNGQPQFNIVETIDRPTDPAAEQDRLRGQINSGALDAYLLVPQDIKQPAELHTHNSGNFALMGTLSAALNRALILKRLSVRGIHLDDANEITGAADLKVIRVSKNGESVERGQTIGVSIALVILLYVSLVSYGILTMRSVLEEKTTRTMEVLVSSVRPFELLAGKITGVAGMAFTQLLIWCVFLGLLLSYGAVMSATAGADSPLAGIHIPVSLLAYAVVFFLGGYFLYSAMFAAIGSACSSEQDAQQLQWLAMGPLVFTMCIYSLVLSDPSGKMSTILSVIPFFSPVLMPLRVSLQTPPIWQMALAIALLFLTTVGAIYASGLIYRVGVLMYGKRPTLPEMLRWLRYS